MRVGPRPLLGSETCKTYLTFLIDIIILTAAAKFLDILKQLLKVYKGVGYPVETKIANFQYLNFLHGYFNRKESI